MHIVYGSRYFLEYLRLYISSSVFDIFLAGLVFILNKIDIANYADDIMTIPALVTLTDL